MREAVVWGIYAQRWTGGKNKKVLFLVKTEEKAERVLWKWTVVQSSCLWSAAGVMEWTTDLFSFEIWILESPIHIKKIRISLFKWPHWDNLIFRNLTDLKMKPAWGEIQLLSASVETFPLLEEDNNYHHTFKTNVTISLVNNNSRFIFLFQSKLIKIIYFTNSICFLFALLLSLLRHLQLWDFSFVMTCKVNSKI